MAAPVEYKWFAVIVGAGLTVVAGLSAVPALAAGTAALTLDCRLLEVERWLPPRARRVVWATTFVVLGLAAIAVLPAMLLGVEGFATGPAQWLAFVYDLMCVSSCAAAVSNDGHWRSCDTGRWS